jgi:low temperature requirement protein LtrA
MRIAVSRAPGAERVVTPLELFFDLVYVCAISQLSHHLLEHPICARRGDAHRDAGSAPDEPEASGMTRTWGVRR